MARLIVLGSSAEVSPGDRVLDACDEIGAPVSFSCRNTTCGICLVRIVRGAELLAAPSEDEASLLADLGVGREARLACQLFVTGENGTIELDPMQKSRVP